VPPTRDELHSPGAAICVDQGAGVQDGKPFCIVRISLGAVPQKRICIA